MSTLKLNCENLSPNVFLMGLTQDRLGKEYKNGQLGNVEAVGLGIPGRRHKTKINANDNTYALAA